MRNDILATVVTPNHGNIPEDIDKKECINTFTAVVLRDGEFHEPVRVRWYRSRGGDGASPVHCVIFVNAAEHRQQLSTRGSGRAGGSGYCKRSGAFGAALDAAGITVNVEVHGTGMDIVHSTIGAIARSVGYAFDPIHVVRS